MKKIFLFTIMLFCLICGFYNCGGDTQSRAETANISPGNGVKYQVFLKCPETGYKRQVFVSAANPDKAKTIAIQWVKQNGMPRPSVIKIVLRNS